MKKPFLHALAAIGYIILLVFIVSHFESGLEEKGIVVPMVMLSILVLSVAVMGFLFFYEPVHLYMENKKKEALTFFGRMVGSFACLVAILLICLLLI